MPEFIKLTNEVGKWAGDITQAKLPDYFEVDYVRVYDKVGGYGEPGPRGRGRLPWHKKR